MKITDKRIEIKPTVFNDLEIGSFFEFENKIYLKTFEAKTLKLGEEDCYNSFNFTGNTRAFMYPEDPVRYLDTELVITGVKI